MSTSKMDCQSFGLAVKTLKKQKIVAQKIGGRSERLHQTCTRQVSIDRRLDGAGWMRMSIYLKLFSSKNESLVSFISSKASFIGSVSYEKN